MPNCPADSIIDGYQWWWLETGMPPSFQTLRELGRELSLNQSPCRLDGGEGEGEVPSHGGVPGKAVGL